MTGGSHRGGSGFPRRVNARRLELLAKMASGFTEEEQSRPRVPGSAWRDECMGRMAANLTAAERDELARCTRALEEWWEDSPGFAEVRRAWMTTAAADMDLRGIR